MGANAIGDVAELMRIARPTVGLITNAGAEHLEGFGNLDGVAKGEGETLSCLEPDGTAIINADDPYAGYWRGVSGAQRIVTFGVHAERGLHGEKRLSRHRARRIRHPLYSDLAARRARRSC